MGANMYEPDVTIEPDPNKVETWPTPNLALAAWLVFSDHEIVDVEIHNGQQAYWFFVSTAQLKEDVMLYSSGDALVEPHEYYGCIQAARKKGWEKKPPARRTNRSA